MEEFLKHFPYLVIQTFDDREYVEKDKSLTICLRGSEIKEPELRKLNSQGAGVFFTPNRFSRGIRKKIECDGINAWFMECDWCSKEEQMMMIKSAPLKPSFIVETKKSLHTYWLAKEATTENFEIIQKRLIYNFQADEAIKDCSRVLRIPGFNHHKTKEPFMVKLPESNPERVYTEAQMLEAFKRPTVQKSSNIWEAMGNLDNRIVLERLSGQKIVNGETFSFRKRSAGSEYIDVNGKPSDAWLDIEGKIGSGKGGAPTWIQWLKYYKRTPKEIFAWAMQNLSDILPELNSDITIKELDFEKVFRGKKMFTWGTTKMDEEATALQQEQYVVLAGETGSGKTTFALHMAIENSKKYRVLYLSLEMSNEALMLRYALSQLGVSVKQWQNGQYDKEAIMRKLHSIPSSLCFKEMEDTNIKTIKNIIDQGNYDMAFIDNLGFIDAGKIDKNDQLQEISRNLKWLANETGVCVIALHHFRKRAGEKEGIRNLDALIGTSKIAHDANLIVQLYRKTGDTITEEEKEEVLIIIQKDRDFGHEGIYKIQFNKGKYVSH